MTMVTRTATIIGAAVGIALLTAYVIVTVTNHDGTALLALLVGWLGGSSVPAVSSAVTKSGGG